MNISASAVSVLLSLLDISQYRGAAVFLVLVAVTTGAAAQEPYRFYGGDVDNEGKTPAQEACEYEELVEKQRCNRALNKTGCIDAVREECRERAEGSVDAEDSEDRQR